MLPFLFGKQKYSDEQKLLFQRWHEFTIKDQYDLKYIHHTGTQMIATIPIPESKDEHKIQHFAEELRRNIEIHGLRLEYLCSTRFHYIIAVEVAKEEGE